MPDDLAGVFYVAELDAGIAEDFDEFSDRAGIATAVATDGDDLAREATAPPLRGRFSPPTGRIATTLAASIHRRSLKRKSSRQRSRVG